MLYPARDTNCISDAPNIFLSIDHRADFTFLNMKDLILMYVNVFERDVSARMHGPLHGVRLFRERNTAECLAGDQIREGLIKVDCHVMKPTGHASSMTT